MSQSEVNLQLDSSELYKRRTDHLKKVMADLSLDSRTETIGIGGDVTSDANDKNATNRTPPRTRRESEGPLLQSTPKSPSTRNGQESVARSPFLHLDLMVCAKCGDCFGENEKIVNSCGQVWHPECFVCAQCFQRFAGDIYYEFEGRNYCDYDFRQLFIPTCAKCSKDITGRLIRALGRNWHDQCLRCRRCDVLLSEIGLVGLHGRPYCRKCRKYQQMEYIGKLICAKCEEVIDEEPFRYDGNVYHAYHFNCKKCGIELTTEGREVSGEPHCLKCHDKMATSVCAACRTPIEGARVVCALGKKWHVEHFVCSHCSRPFNGRKFFEKRGYAYCETHFEQLFGDVCFVCNMPSTEGFKSLNKMWCPKHFCCSCCDRLLTTKTRFFDIDLRPVCKKCYEKFPNELRKRLLKMAEKSPFFNKK